jgi:enoyl-CoA hydratase
LTKAEEHALTGKPLSGREAAEIELINKAVPFEQLEAEVARQAQQLAGIPSSQLAAMKLIVNQAYENMGLHSTQPLGPILDGLMRNTPDAHAFIDKASREGVGAATNERDAPFDDYSVAGPERRPDSGHAIEPSDR